MINQLGGKLSIADEGKLINIVLEVPSLSKQQFDELPEKLKTHVNKMG